MAIGATTVSFSDIRTEFGGSGAVSISDYYRGGTNVRSKAANNNATNLAASVPTSGAIDFSDYRSQAKGFKYTFASGATTQDASTLFGSDWGVNYPKEIIINSGVELGTTNTSEFALELNSGGSGDITLTNNGTITGAGGSAGGGAGGDALRCNVANVTIINNGTIRGGGGGGGAGGSGGNGGTGGQGRTSSTSCGGCTHTCDTRYCNSGGTCRYACGTCLMGDGTKYCQHSIITNYQYHNGGAGGSGGSGGSGGRGQGYNQTKQNGSSGSGGSSGSAGGTNAGSGGNGGSGGSGGTGGTFGNGGGTGGNGNSGSSGANGNYSNGSGGSGGGSGGSGGAAGRAIQVDVAFTLQTTGTMQGAYT